MKIIKDIRLYKSQIENRDGLSLPSDFDNRNINAIIFRIVMKLRENKFSLGDFDHLYINFTTCIEENKIIPAKRSIDKYHSWFRYYDVGVNEKLYRNLKESKSNEKILNLVKMTLLDYFTFDEQTKEIVEFSFQEAIIKGENMLMKFKEKKSAKNKAIIYLRYLNNFHFFPLLRVYDQDGHIILEKDLPQSLDLLQLGHIQLSSKKITIKTRTSSFARNLEPITYEL